MEDLCFQECTFPAVFIGWGEFWKDEVFSSQMNGMRGKETGKYKRNNVVLHCRERVLWGTCISPATAEPEEKT